MEDIAERTVDELQYLNLGFRQAFGHVLVRINDLRSVTQVLTLAVQRGIHYESRLLG